MQKFYKMPLIFICLTMMTGCPVMMKNVIKNESKQPIYLIQSPTNEKKIKFGKTTTDYLSYNPDCIHIRLREEIYQYQWDINMVGKYINTGVFFNSVNSVFTNDKKLKIYNKNNVNDFIELKEQCTKQP